MNRHLPRLKSRIFRLINAYLPPIIWALIIFFLSNQQTLPGPDLILLDFLLKKTGHVVVYAVFYWLIWRACNLTLHPDRKNLRWLLPFIICLGYALSDEIHQSFVPNRHATLRDIGFDTLGSSLAFMIKYRYL